MFKDLRRKTKLRKNRVPDEFFQGGGISMARFGKFVVQKNTMTPEQHKVFMKRAAVEYLRMCMEINTRVFKIRDFVQEFNPLILLQCGYFHFVMSTLGKISETEYGREDISIARMLDYIQGVIVSTPSHGMDKTEFDQAAWDKLFEEVKSLYDVLAPWFQISRSAFLKATQKDYDMNYDSFYVQEEMLWLSVRCDRYSVHDMPHLRDLLTPHDKIFNELFGIPVSLFLQGIEKIQFSLSRGLGTVVEEMHEFMDKIFAAVDSKKDSIPENDLPAHMRQIVREKGWKNWGQSIADRFVGFDLFDVQKITGLPTSLLRELSWEPGEEKHFFAPGAYSGWPLRLLPVQVRPFLCVKDRYYCFDLANLMDNIYRIIQRLIIQLRPDYKEPWNSCQKVVSESIPFTLFGKLFPNAKTYRNIFYRGAVGASGHWEWCESDGLIIFDDHLVVLEIKGGAFTSAPPTTNFDAYINSIKELVMKPALQTKRFIDHLYANQEVILYDVKYKPIATIRRGQFRVITACCVTLDNFTELATRSQVLKPLGVDIPIPIWSLAVDDLRVYADILDSPIIFAHFLEQRKKAAGEPNFEVFDELDHLGMYLSHNLYVDYACDLIKSQKPTYVNWYGYRKELDIYYHNLLIEPDKAVKPLQKTNKGYFKDIIELLGVQKKSGCCKAGSYLLDMSGDARKNFDLTIDDILSRQKRKARIIPASFFGAVKLTIFCHLIDMLPPTIDWMHDYTFARMLIANDETRMILQMRFDDKNKVVDVDFEFLALKNMPPDHHAHIKQWAEDIRKEAIERAMKEQGRIGRNDLCPCGSGKKYKRCCGLGS